MCGIAGIISKSSSLDEKALASFRDGVMLMKHRGPNHFGERVEGKVALFHHRLSILDLDQRSHQPFSSRDGSVVSVYNGEVYNFQDLKKARNISTRTTSDTEVLVESFVQSGLDCIKEWNGIFAFCALNVESNKLWIARDRFGVKPLYIFEDDYYFMFASEAKVIYHYLKQLPINYQALAEYMLQGNTISKLTIVEGVHKLMPGQILEYDLKSSSYSFQEFYSNPGTMRDKLSFEATSIRTQELLEAAIQRQLVSDVPVGVFLSGGIDSSAVTAFASRNSEKKISTYSVEFDFNRGGVSELEKARKVAKLFNTNHHELKVESKNIIQIFEDLVFQHDEPFSDAANIPLYLLTKAVRKDLTVVLQGDGGDELFAGYPRYDLLNSPHKWKLTTLGAKIFLPNALDRKRAKRVHNALSQPEDYMKLALLTTAFKNEDFELFNSDISVRLHQADLFKSYRHIESKYSSEILVQRMLYTDVEIELPHTFLDKVDKSTMLNSIEARVPFLDNELATFAFSVPVKYKVHKGEKKYLLRSALRNVVPDEILDSPKRGFDVPMEIWLRETMLEYTREKLTGRIGRELLSQDRIKKLMDEHLSHKEDRSHLIWKLLVLVTWVERYESKIIFDKVVL